MIYTVSAGVPFQVSPYEPAVVSPVTVVMADVGEVMVTATGPNPCAHLPVPLALIVTVAFWQTVSR